MPCGRGAVIDGVEDRVGVVTRRLVVGRIGIDAAAAQHLLDYLTAPLVDLPAPR